jgi:hypothetical protein
MRAPEDVPLWVPAPIRRNVIAWLKNPQYREREYSRDLAILLRLATDLRMRTVWPALGNPPPFGNTRHPSSNTSSSSPTTPRFIAAG